MTSNKLVPYHKYEIARSVSKIEYLTEPEYLALYGAAKHPENKLLIRLLWETGLRIHEALGLRYGDVYPDNLNILGKGKKQRIVYVQATVLGDLLRYARGHERDNIFQKLRTRQAANLMLKRTAAAIGLTKNIHNHLFRHSYAINFLKQTGNPFALQSQGGWSNMETVKIYMRLANEMPAEAVAKMYFPQVK